IRRYSDILNKAMEVVIGETLVPLDARESVVRREEAPLGDFIADAMRAAVQADLAITNGGGIRTDAVLEAGPIRRRNVIAWLPFGNVVVKVALRGAAIREALENGVSRWDQLAGRFPQVSGLRFTFNPGRPVGSRILEVRAGDRPLDDGATYTVATNDFMLRGGDGYGMLSQGAVLINPAGGPLMASVVADAVRSLKSIGPKPEGRGVGWLVVFTPTVSITPTVVTARVPVAPSPRGVISPIAGPAPSLSPAAPGVMILTPVRATGALVVPVQAPSVSDSGLSFSTWQLVIPGPNPAQNTSVALAQLLNLSAHQPGPPGAGSSPPGTLPPPD